MDTTGRSRRRKICGSAALLMAVFALAYSRAQPPMESPSRPQDATAWGDDHVDRDLPSYITGDECLFCHRTIGPSWGGNAHHRTLRRAAPDDPQVVALAALPAAAATSLTQSVDFVMGSRHATCFLRRAPEYGKLELLSTLLWKRPAGEDSAGDEEHRWQQTDPLEWQSQVFGDRCAGCHATAVDAGTRAFAAVGLDCYVCHGDVPLGHTKDAQQVLLSTSNREPRQVASICGSCHLRGGKSKSSGLPYPNHFVAGDNLFRDFTVDFSDRALERLPPQEYHIFRNARDAATGAATMTCLDCHRVHDPSSEIHQVQPATQLCAACHTDTSGSELRNEYRGESGPSTLHATCLPLQPKE